MRPRGAAEDLEARRRRAIDLLRSGMKPGEVADEIGVVRQTVQKWKALVRDGGKRAIKAIPQYVNTRRISDDQLKELRRIIKAGASNAGYKTDTWTTARLAEIIRRRFKISYNADHVGRMLREAGIYLQKTSKRARVVRQPKRRSKRAKT